jgi:hypothetical protein
MVENETWLRVATGKASRLPARADPIQPTFGQAPSSKFSQPASFNSSVIGDAGGGSFDLNHHGAEYFLDADSGCGALVISPFVKELIEQGRDYLLLDPIVVNLPRTRTVEESDASCAGAKREMHWQTITADQALVVPDVRQVLKER